VASTIVTARPGTLVLSGRRAAPDKARLSPSYLFARVFKYSTATGRTDTTMMSRISLSK
jgi:hypothetical protein